MLPDFESDAPTVEEEEHYLTGLLTNQLSLARAVCSSSIFAALLHKRLIVLQRIFHAVGSKYHDHEKPGAAPQDQDAGSAEDHNKQVAQAVSGGSGSGALIEVAVKTGLSLVFSILRQNWNLPPQVAGERLCNDVLATALDVVRGLPPLSLANESKLPTIGLTSLTQVTDFLKSVAMQQSGADETGCRLASELVLALAAQRGSLRYLLEWVEMALCASAACCRQQGREAQQQPGPHVDTPGTIRSEVFISTLRQMKKSAVSQRLFFQHLVKDKTVNQINHPNVQYQNF